MLQLRQTIRLIDKACGPRFFNPLHLRGGERAGGYQDPYPWIHGQQVLEHLQAVAVGQVKIQDHQVRVFQAAKGFQAFPPVLGQFHLIPHMLQKFFSQRANQRVIVNQQD